MRSTAVLRAAVALLALCSTEARASMALRPMPSTRGSYGESFTFIADLDDGTYVQLSLGFTNLGPGSVKGLCRALVVPPSGAVWNASTRVGRDGWSWSESTGERLAVGSCSASVEGERTEVEVPLDGGSVRLRLEGRALRRAAADATFTVGDDYYRSEILLYRVALSATVSVPGTPSRTVAGGGYVDHSRSTVKPKDLAEQWVRFRALRGDRGAVLLGRRAHDGRFAPVWACDPPGRCRHFPSFAVDRSGADRKVPAFRITLPTDGGPLEIRSRRLLYRDAPLEQLGVLAKLVTPFFGSPVTYVYRAQLEGGGVGPLDGILEVEMSGE